MALNTAGVPAPLATFIARFYALSDDESAHEAYAESFAWSNEGGATAAGGPQPQVFFQIGPMPPASTREGVLAWRHKAWEAVAAREHSVHDVYIPPAAAAQAPPLECMLHGRVDYVKRGSSEGGAAAAAAGQQKSGATWASRMAFDRRSVEKGEPRMVYYRVWIVGISHNENRRGGKVTMQAHQIMDPLSLTLRHLMRRENHK